MCVQLGRPSSASLVIGRSVSSENRIDDRSLWLAAESQALRTKLVSLECGHISHRTLCTLTSGQCREKGLIKNRSDGRRENDRFYISQANGKYRNYALTSVVVCNNRNGCHFGLLVPRYHYRV